MRISHELCPGTASAGPRFERSQPVSHNAPGLTAESGHRSFRFEVGREIPKRDRRMFAKYIEPKPPTSSCQTGQNNRALGSRSRAPEAPQLPHGREFPTRHRQRSCRCRRRFTGCPSSEMVEVRREQHRACAAGLDHSAQHSDGVPGIAPPSCWAASKVQRRVLRQFLQ